jgi:DNA-binding Xre family transcriptional regulator
MRTQITKIKAEKCMESHFEELEKEIKKEHTFFVDFGLDFAKQVRYVLSIHPTIKTQKDLANALGKKESEISRMMTGLHNLTLESISKICGVLDYDLILTDLKAQQKYNSHLVSTNTVKDSNDLSQ